MEQEIFMIGLRKIHSTKQEKDFYMVDYVKGNTPKTDYINALEYNNIGKKVKPFTKQIGIFSINDYDKVYLSDLK